MARAVSMAAKPARAPRRGTNRRCSVDDLLDLGESEAEAAAGCSSSFVPTFAAAQAAQKATVLTARLDSAFAAAQAAQKLHGQPRLA